MGKHFDFSPQMSMSIPQLDGGTDESPKRNRSKFQPLNIIKRPNSGRALQPINHLKLTTFFIVSDSVVEMLKGKTEITVCAIPSRHNQYNNQSFDVE